MAKIVANWVNQKKQWLVQIKDDGTLKARRLELDEPIESGISYITAGLGLLGGTITSGGTISVNFGTTVNQVARGNHFHNAVSIPILDSGNYYSAANVEDALQEVGEALYGSELDIVSSKLSYGIKPMYQEMPLVQMDYGSWLNARRRNLNIFAEGKLNIIDEDAFSIYMTGLLGSKDNYTYTWTSEEFPAFLLSNTFNNNSKSGYHMVVDDVILQLIGSVITTGDPAESSIRIVDVNRSPFTDESHMNKGAGASSSRSNIYCMSPPLSIMPYKALMDGDFDTGWWNWIYVDAHVLDLGWCIEGYSRYSSYQLDPDTGQVDITLPDILPLRYRTTTVPDEIIDFTYGGSEYLYVLTLGNKIYRVKRTTYEDSQDPGFERYMPIIEHPLTLVYTDASSNSFTKIAYKNGFIYLVSTDNTVAKIRVSDFTKVNTVSIPTGNWGKALLRWYDDALGEFWCDEHPIGIHTYANRLLVNMYSAIYVFDLDSLTYIKRIYKYVYTNDGDPDKKFTTFSGLYVNDTNDLTDDDIQTTNDNQLVYSDKGVYTLGFIFESNSGTPYTVDYIKIDFTSSNDKPKELSSKSFIDSKSVILSGSVGEGGYYGWGATLQDYLDRTILPADRWLFTEKDILYERLRNLPMPSILRYGYFSSSTGWTGITGVISITNQKLYNSGTSSLTQTVSTDEWNFDTATIEGKKYYLRYEYNMTAKGHSTSGVRIKFRSDASSDTSLDVSTVSSGYFSKIITAGPLIQLSTGWSGPIMGNRLDIIFNRNTQMTIDNVYLRAIDEFNLTETDEDEIKALIDTYMDEEYYPKWIAGTGDTITSYEQFYMNFVKLRKTVNTLETTVNEVVSDKHYFHNQQVSQTVWTINHNLNKIPSILTIDSFDFEMIGDIQVIDNNNITITFTVPVFGKAYLN